MGILIFTNRDLASNLNLNVLLPRIGAQVKHIFVSDKVGGKNAAPPPKALRELKFFEQELPNEILFPQLDAQYRATDSGKLLTFNELSQKYNIPITALNDVRSAESLAQIAALQPDLVLSVRYGKIFGNDFVRIPRHGVINLHSGLLPQYRGVLATFRALLQGDAVIGCTLHYIDDATIDTGGVIGFSNLEVNPERSLLWHILQLYPVSADLVVASIEQIMAGQKPATLIQDSSKAQYFSFPSQAEVDEFMAQGWSFADTADYSAFIRQYL